jgi:hypothetical protein
VNTFEPLFWILIDSSIDLFSSQLTRIGIRVLQNISAKVGFICHGSFLSLQMFRVPSRSKTPISASNDRKLLGLCPVPFLMGWEGKGRGRAGEERCCKEASRWGEWRGKRSGTCESRGEGKYYVEVGFKPVSWVRSCLLKILILTIRGADMDMDWDHPWVGLGPEF